MEQIVKEDTQKLIVRSIFILCLVAFVATGWLFLSEERSNQDKTNTCTKLQDRLKELVNWNDNMTDYCKVWIDYRHLNCSIDNSQAAKTLDIKCSTIF